MKVYKSNEVKNLISVILIYFTFLPQELSVDGIKFTSCRVHRLPMMGLLTPKDPNVKLLRVQRAPVGDN